jgi:hypothetical protein
MKPLVGGPAQTLVRVPGGTVEDAVWSPESHFILFSISKSGSNGQIYATRFSPSSGAPDTHWIEITAASDFSRKPRWSGDGKTIFYLSKRDGHWCLWGRHFSSTLGRAVGAAFPVQHFHNPKFSPSEIYPTKLNVSVAGDSVYLNVLETSGTIWLGKLAKRSLVSQFQ